jgi:hypothetical protein
MHTLFYIYNCVVMYLKAYMFRAQLVHHQGVGSWIQQSLDHIIISNMRDGRRFVTV